MSYVLRGTALTVQTRVVKKTLYALPLPYMF